MKHGSNHRNAECITLATSIVRGFVSNAGQLDQSQSKSVFNPCPSVAKYSSLLSYYLLSYLRDLRGEYFNSWHHGDAESTESKF